MPSYGTHCSENGMLLAFYRAEQEIYSTFPEYFTMDSNSVVQKIIDGKRYILISANICNDEYQIFVAKDIDSLDSELRTMMYVYLATSA